MNSNVYVCTSWGVDSSGSVGGHNTAAAAASALLSETVHPFHELQSCRCSCFLQEVAAAPCRHCVCQNPRLWMQHACQAPLYWIFCCDIYGNPSHVYTHCCTTQFLARLYKLSGNLLLLLNCQSTAIVGRSNTCTLHPYLHPVDDYCCIQE
jgi:hypothetical protein